MTAKHDAPTADPENPGAAAGPPGPARLTPEKLWRVPSRLLVQSAAHADRIVSAGLARADARKWHYAVLVALAESGPGSQATLSRWTGVYRSDLVAVINELAERGLVERTPDPADRRRNVITLTAQGREKLQQLDQVLADAQDDLLAPLSGAERATLTGLLARLVEYHGDQWT
ncbi:MAG TPA: MarR family transcriptional regulator [Actinocrinis sp.]|nr:MarR family transcriptional regulator [Actinocrinis sp.]